MIKVNGHDAEWREGMTVRDLMRDHAFKSPRIIVKVNGTWVRQSDWDTHHVQDGDDVRVLHMIAGG